MTSSGISVLDKYAEQGFLSPLEGLAASEAAQLMQRLKKEIAALEERKSKLLA